MENRFHMNQKENTFVAKRILVDSIYRSADLEGIAVTYADTIDILNNVNVGRLRLDEITAILNLRDSWYYILDHLDAKLDLAFIQQCHARIVYRSREPIGAFRNYDVLISGTSWRPEIPNIEQCHKELVSIQSIKNPTDRSLTLMLWIMRRQMFCDGNKRVATVVANHEMIKNGCGVISIPVELAGRFISMLVQYYETNEMQEIKQFLFDHCIGGIEFETRPERCKTNAETNELEHP